MTSISGEGEFRQLADRLNAVGDAKLRREIYKGLREIARPVGEAMTAAGAAAMPERGGMADRVKNTRIGQQNATTGKNPRVVLLLRQKDGIDLNALDRGTLRHPTFGGQPWVRQSVTPRSFTTAFEATAPLVKKNLERHIEKVLDEIGR